MILWKPNMRIECITKFVWRSNKKDQPRIYQNGNLMCTQVEHFSSLRVDLTLHPFRLDFPQFFIFPWWGWKYTCFLDGLNGILLYVAKPSFPIAYFVLCCLLLCRVDRKLSIPKWVVFGLNLIGRLSQMGFRLIAILILNSIFSGFIFLPLVFFCRDHLRIRAMLMFFGDPNWSLRQLLKVLKSREQVLAFLP